MLRQSSSFGVAVVKQHGIEFSIVRFEEIDNGAFVNFICRISKDGKTWELQKRYSEFRFFYQAVAEYTSKVATNFPSKSVCLILLCYVIDVSLGRKIKSRRL